MPRSAWLMLLVGFLVSCADTGSGGSQSPDVNVADVRSEDVAAPLDVAVDTARDDVQVTDLGDELADAAAEIADADDGDATALDVTSMDAEVVDAETDASADVAPEAALEAGMDVDTTPGPCSLCHGDYESPAPPRSLMSERVTTARGVGAHRAHLRAGRNHREVQCDDCHRVPTDLTDPGHIDSPRPAELTWSAVATSDGAMPAFNGTTCTNTYCHGATLLPGGTNTTPTWANADGTSQATCGTCHGLPPGGGHPNNMQCETCHADVMGPGMTFVNPRLHINGHVDLSISGCDVCHGGSGNPAPPRDTAGGTATTLRGVGAHRSHLAPSTTHRDIACTDCHTVPSSITAAGHLDTALPAELTWSALATTRGVTPTFNGTTCTNTYCHGGGLLPGGTNTAPTWARVDGSQAACGTCHGLPPGGRHPVGDQCETCHGEVIGPGRVFVNPRLHINGRVEVAVTGCDGCHGGAGVSAPPRDTAGGTATTLRGVGAHRAHLAPSTTHHEVSCEDCHVVPGTVGATGHNDTALPAELTWSALATTRGVTPAFNGTTCTNTYCHGGGLLPGGTNTAPTWARVDGSQAACGTCHGLPPGGRHPAGSACETCHGEVIGPGRVFVNPRLHINGQVEVAITGCDGCHGSAGDSSPPRDTTGGTATTLRGVGAHRNHLRTSTWRAPIECSDCHIVPGSVASAGHNDTALPAELSWGARATTDRAVPVWNGTTCSNTYCHGSTLLPGGSNTTPIWARVDGSQATCGTCHGLPPGGTHPTSTRCELCHGDVVGAGMLITNPARHINGVVDVTTPTCDTCHGSTGNPAPPRDTTGGTATTLRGVGAHRAHLNASTWRAGIACTDCHTVPSTLTAAGHIDTALPAELTWGPRATTRGVTPAFNGTTCTNNYCHGAGLLPGGTNTAPAWARVDGTQAACGTCHGLPPGGSHPMNTRCEACHGDVIGPGGVFVAPSLHINGVVNVTLPGCESCHGGGGSSAPPTDLSGGTATTLRTVGAHRNHLRTSSWRAPIACTECHILPARVTSAGHLDTARPAELTWGTLATSDRAAPVWNGTTCSNTYCHGATLLPGGTNTNPTWARVDGSQAACGTCHGLPPGGTHPMNDRCEACHGDVVGPGRVIINPARHINGVVDVTAASCDSCHGSPGNPAPPRDTTGGTATTLRTVGAHRNHLNASTWRAPIACTECHVMPSRVTAPGHLDTSRPAEVTWGALAAADRAAPAWNGTTCTNTYCHGTTLQPGGTVTTPTWTRIDGTQVACGTCHGLPPGGTHYALTRCEVCHSAVIGPGRVFTTPSLHINGIVESNLVHSTGWRGPPHGVAVNTTGITPCQECHGAALDGGGSRVSCSSSSCHTAGWQTNCTLCHGGTDNMTGAPPVGIRNETARTTLAVGAHTSHVQNTATHLAWNCTRCHTTPANALSAGHIDGDGRSEVVFDSLNPTGSYDRATGRCASSYCHGNGRASNGAIVWGTPATLTCSSCHNDATTPTSSWTMSGQHRRHVISQHIACNECHNTVVSATNTIIGLNLHVNGLKEVSLRRGGTYTPTGRLTCRPACHGSEVWN